MANERDRQDRRSISRIVEHVEFNTIFTLAFVILLAAAVLKLVMPWTWRRRLANERRWFVGRAWDEAGSFAEFAFMG